MEHPVSAVPVDGHRRVERVLKLCILQRDTRPFVKLSELLLRQQPLQVRLHHAPVRAVAGVHEHPRARVVPVVDHVRQPLGHRVLGAQVAANAGDAEDPPGAGGWRGVEFVPLEPHALADGGIRRLLFLGVVTLEEGARVRLGGHVLPARGRPEGEPLRDVPVARAQPPDLPELIPRRSLEILRRLVHDGGGERPRGRIHQRVKRLGHPAQHHVVLLTAERRRLVERLRVPPDPLFPRGVVAVGLDVHRVHRPALLVAVHWSSRGEHNVLDDG